MNTNSQPVVRSLLETDLYKFTMWQAFLHRAPGAIAESEFFCRNEPEFPLAELRDQVEVELDRLCEMRFLPDELEYLAGRNYIKRDFVDFLRIFQYQRQFIRVGTNGDKLTITASGPLVHITGFEIPVLYFVNELYFRRLTEGKTGVVDEGRRRLETKIEQIRAGVAQRRHPYKISDFGLRRRFSGAWQDEIVGRMKAALPEHFAGTSNVFLAMKHGVTPIGTMAHEYLQAHQAFGGQLRDSQKAALENWVQEYRGDLGIALTDVIGMNQFLRDFDLYFAKLFDGLRHDSGDPYPWGQQAIDHYRKLRIDPNTKTLVFSDGLNIPKSLALHSHFANDIAVGFGVGTDLTNDLGPRALNIVMKIMTCNGKPVAKLSDTPGKTLCRDPEFVSYLRHVFEQA